MVEFRSKLDSGKSQALNSQAFKKSLWLFILAGLALAAVGAWKIVLREDYADLVIGIVLLVAGILFTPLMYLLSSVVQNRVDKTTTYISSDTEEVFTFDDRYITVTQTKGDEFMSTTKAKYSYIYKAYEDEKYYYLYISKVQSHVIDKTSITQGTLDELDALLKTNLGYKFNTKK